MSSKQKSFKKSKKDFKAKLDKFEFDELKKELGQIPVKKIKKILKSKKKSLKKGSRKTFKDEQEEEKIKQLFLMTGDIDEMQKKIEEMQKQEKEMELALLKVFSDMEEVEMTDLMSDLMKSEKR